MSKPAKLLEKILLGTADGATKQAALKNVDVIIKEWIATAKTLGRPIPEPKGRLVFARLPHD